jgi:hypothetical protein
MKKLFSTFLLSAFFTAGFAQVKMPAPSPTEFIKQDFGLSSIELTYSRPSLKGRKMIGNVEPWNVMWRTGANMATKIKFNEPVEILGHKVDSGSYAIYTIPQKNGDWTFILNKGANNSGVSGYNESDDVLREKVKAGKNAMKVETLTMQFSDLQSESCALNIKWEDFALKILVKVNIKDKIRASIEEALKSDKKPYWQAAQFYNDFDNNKTKALEMIDAAIKENPKAPFYMVYYKAKIQSEAGDKKGALATAQQSLELSKEAKNDGYILLSEKLIKESK